MSDFDPVSAGDRPAGTGVQEAPGQRPAGPANSFGDRPAVNEAAVDPMAHWRNLYGGLDGIDERVTPEQKRAFSTLDMVVRDPTVERARAVNESFIRARPGMNGPVLGNNWDAAKSAYVKSEFGLDAKDLPEKSLYDLIGQRIGAKDPARQDEGEIKPWTWRDTLIDDYQGAKRNLGRFWDSINKPAKELPEPPADIPYMPGMGYNQPAVAAGVYKGIKPLLESLESPLGIATLGVGPALAAAAKTMPLAGVALRGMSGFFGALMGYSTAQALPESKRILSDPNVSLQDKVAAIVGPATTALGAVAGTMHAAFGEIPERAPALAKQIEGKTPTQTAELFRQEAVVAHPDAADALNRAASQLDELAAYDRPPDEWAEVGREKIAAPAIRTAEGEVVEGEHVNPPEGAAAGFVTTEGRFVDATEAHGIATSADQIKKGETVAGAAIKLDDGTVLTGRNHIEILPKIEQHNAARGVVDPEYKTAAEHGFVTSEGRFISREEASTIADAAGQITDKYLKMYGEAPETLFAQQMNTPEEIAGKLQPARVDYPRPRSAFNETSLKNAYGDLERVAYGFDAAPEPEQRSMAERWARSGEIVAKDPEAGARLASQLKANPNLGLSDDQSALLLRHKVGLERALNEAADKAADPNTAPAAKLEANAQMQHLSKELLDLLDAVNRRGAEWGREGRWRQALAREDYSFASQETLLMASKGGRELTPEETAGLQQRVKELEAKQRELETAIAKQRIAPRRAAERSAPLIPATARAALSSAADAARARLRERLTQVNDVTQALIDAPGTAKDLAIIAADHLARYAEDGAAAAEAMVRELGDWVKPYVGKAIKGGKKLLERSRTRPQTETPPFKKWKGDAKLVRAGEPHEYKTGDPVVVEAFHGTTHDFDVVDASKGNIENDFGRAFYASNSPRDVEANYAGVGPDLEGRISRRSEQIEQDVEGKEPTELAEELGVDLKRAKLLASSPKYGTPQYEARQAALRELAQADLTSHGGATMKVFIRLKNPLVLGGKNERYWELHHDEELDAATGDSVKFSEALQKVGARYDVDASHLSDILIDGGKPSELIEKVKNDDTIGQTSDPITGDLAGHQIIKEALEEMGYDGVIDLTANKKFGSERRIGKQMEGMDENTVHVVAFESASIKSAIGNSGGFKEGAPSIVDADSKTFSNRVLADPLSKAPKKTVWLSDAGKAALDRLNQRIERKAVLYAVDPGKLEGSALADLATVGGDLIYNTGLNFAKWSAKMVSELGEAVRPHLESVWEQSKAIYRKTVLDNLAAGAGPEGPSNLPRVALQLARGFIEEGIHGRDAVVDAVHAEIVKTDPTVSRRDVVDAISGYGKFRPLTRDQITDELRDVKGQLLQVAKLEDMAAGKAPKKTGPERRAPSDEERRLIQQVEEKKKEGGYVVTDPEKQLRTALDAAHRNVENRIKDLAHEFETGEKPKKGTPGPTDARLEMLKAFRDRVAKVVESIEGKPEDTPEKRIARSVRSTTAAIERLEKALDDGKVFPEGVKSEPWSQELGALKAKLQELKDFQRDLRKALDPGPTPAERALAAVKTRLKGQIDDLEKQIATGERADPKAPNRIALDEESERLKAKRDALKEQFEGVFGPKKLSEEQRLNIWKAYAKRRTAQLEAKIAEQDFAPKQKRPAPALDAEGIKIKSELERIKQDFAIARATAEEAAKPPVEKALRTVSDLARASALSGYHTLGKLAAFSLWKFAEKPVTEGLGALIKGLPGVERIARTANLEAGAEYEAIGRFYGQAATQGIEDAIATLKTGKSDLKAELADQRANVQPVRWYDYFGLSHMAEKGPLLRGEFELRLAKGMEAAVRAGVDVTDPLVQGAIRKEAFTYAEREILQEKNMFSDWLNTLTQRLEAANPKTGKADLAKFALSTFIKTFLTKGIVKTPANYVMQTLERTPLGLAKGTAQAVVAHIQGVDKLTPEEANTIIRLFKVGGVGTAMFVWGYLDASKDPKDRAFGGYYQRGEKRGADDVSWGKIRVGNVEISHLFTHNPMTEVAQMGSTMYRVMHSKLHKKDAADRGALAGAIAATMSLASSAPVVNPVTQIVEKVAAGEEENILWDEIAGLVPQLTQNLAADLDGGKSRKAETLGQRLELTTPILRGNVPETKAQKKKDALERLKK